MLDTYTVSSIEFIELAQNDSLKEKILGLKFVQILVGYTGFTFYSSLDSKRTFTKRSIQYLNFILSTLKSLISIVSNFFVIYL